MAFTPATLQQALDCAAWLLDASHDPMAVVDFSQADLQILHANPALRALVTLPVSLEATAAGLGTGFGINGTTPEWQAMLTRLKMGQTAQVHCRAYRKQHEAFWAELTFHALPCPGNITLAIVTVRDHSAHWLAQRSLRLQVARTQALLSETGEAIAQADSALVLTHLNPAAELLIGCSSGMATGRPTSDVLPLVDAVSGAPLGDPLLKALLTGEPSPWTQGAAVQRQDGSQVPVSYATQVIRDEDGAVIEGWLLMRNTSEASVVAHAMAEQAWQDVLTDLPNRSVFDDRLSQAHALAARHQHRCGLLLVEVADHGATAERHGQDTADKALHDLAMRLRAVFRRSDTVCRVGSARFAVVLPLVNEKANALLLADKARSVATQPVQVQAQTIHLQLRVGVSLFPEHGPSIQALLAGAEAQLSA